MQLRCALWLWVLALLSIVQVPAALANEPLPPAELRLLKPGMKLNEAPLPALTMAPGERLKLRARVTGGQRWWCMFPETYAPIGKNTTIDFHGIDGCQYTVASGSFNRTGTWSVTDERYTWKASGGVITPEGTGEYAWFTAPSKPGTATLDVSGTVKWHLDSVTSRDVTDGPVKAALTVTVEGEESPITKERAWEILMERFFKQIPEGPAATELIAHFGSPGFANNVKDLVGIDGYGPYACGSYQGQVLGLLDQMRMKGTDEEKAVFDHFDYGPIQAYYGGHQAVVVYPKGGAWGTEGTVLDPWPNQKPETMSIADWKSRFWFGVDYSGVYEGLYPISGGSSYPTDTKPLSPELISVYRTLPPDEQARVKAMTPAERETYLSGLPPERAGRVAVGVHSPVDVLVTSQYGQRVGFLPDGTFVYEIPGADVDFFPEADGSHGAAFFLPYNVYDVEVRGRAPGTYDLTLAVPSFAAGDAITRHYGVSTDTGVQTTVSFDPTQPARQAIIDAKGETVAPVTVLEKGAASTGGSSAVCAVTGLSAVSGAAWWVTIGLIGWRRRRAHE